jgi:hypothetical protein
LLIGAPTYQWLMLDLQTDQGSNCGSCTLKIDLGKTAREPATNGSFAPGHKVAALQPAAREQEPRDS